jgi:hypothetical protein
LANRRGLGVTRQRKPWRCARRLPRYHALIDEGGATAFSAFVEKATRRPVRLRMAGDGDRLQRAKGSETAIKPERPETKGWLGDG